MGIVKFSVVDDVKEKDGVVSSIPVTGDDGGRLGNILVLVSDPVQTMVELLLNKIACLATGLPR
jgi:hypothetical protein